MEKMGRRTFLGLQAKAWLLFATLTGGLSQMAISCADLYSKISQYVPLGLQAFQTIINLLIASGVIMAIDPAAGIGLAISLAKSSFADLQTAVTEYQQAPATAKATALQRISTVIAVLQQNIQQFWNDLMIPDQKMSALVQGLLGVILTTLAGFATQLPAPAAFPRRTLAKTIPVAPMLRSSKQFKADFNKLLTEAGQDQYQLR